MTNQLKYFVATILLAKFAMVSYEAKAQFKVSSTGNVGIGTSTTNYLLNVVKNQASASRIFLSNNSTSSSAYAIFQATGATGNLYMGNTRAGVLGNSVGTEVNYVQSSGLPFFIGTSGSNEVRLITNATEKVRITSAGNVGIGFTGPTYKLEVNGTTQCSGNVWTSDQQFKTNVDSVHSALAIVHQLKPKSYYFDTTNVYGFNFQSKKQYGFIAQEVEQILPELVFTATKSEDVDSLGNVLHPAITYKSLSYIAFIPILTKGIQELQQKIDNLSEALQSEQEKTAGQEVVNNSLQNQLDQLSERINSCCTLGEERSASANGVYVNQTDTKLSDVQSIILDQNQPNPFSEQTSISYYLPDNAKKAQMLFYNAQGRLIQTVDLKEKGIGMINVFASDLSNGIYTYTLVVDGKVIETKKMIKQ